jgi:flagellar biogenesis protein FliO
VSAPSTAELLLRMVVALALMGGMLWGVVRVARSRRGSSLLGVVAGSRVEHLEVVARRQLSRSSSVALVRCGPRVLLLGVADTGLQVLAEGDELGEPAPVPTVRADPVDVVDDGANIDGEVARTRLPGASGPGPTRTGVVDALRELTVRR